MGNASVAYEVLIYLNSFYFGMFAPCELAIGLLKAINLTYTYNNHLLADASILVSLIAVEGIRIILGRKGSLANRDWQVIISAMLIIPCAIGVLYLAVFQSHKLKLEYTLCILMAALHSSEFWYFISFIMTSCKPTSYV